MEPFLSHSVRLILSNIVVILWWSYLRRIDSLIIISVEYMSDLLYIPIELSSSYQDGSDVLVTIVGHIFLGYLHRRMRQLPYWGIFPLFYFGDDRLLMELLPFYLFSWRIVIRITGHSIDDLCRDEPSKEPEFWVLTFSVPMTLQ